MSYKKIVADVVRELLVTLTINLDDPNFKETPIRMAEWLIEFNKSDVDIKEACEEFSKAVFPHERSDMIVSKPFTVFSMCPHHLLPVEYKVNLGYIPQGHVVGLSKLIRITNAVAKQPLLQEEFTPRLAEILCKYLRTDHVAVKVNGIHSCMRIRGVKNGPPFVNTALRGAFHDKSEVRKEFYDSIGGDY